MEGRRRGRSRLGTYQGNCRLILSTGRLRVVAQGKYRYIRFQACVSNQMDAIRLRRTYGGTFTRVNQRYNWTAADTETIKVIADAINEVKNKSTLFRRLYPSIVAYCTAPDAKSRTSEANTLHIQLSQDSLKLSDL